MSDKKKFSREQALDAGRDILRRLNPFIKMVEFAGSIRRKKQFVSDVEILYIPRYENRQQDFFTSEPFDLAAEEISRMLSEGIIDKRPSVTGVLTWGALNKLAIHRASGIPVDLFCEPSKDDWWRSLVIRTGPKELNIRLIETAAKRFVRVHAYRHGLTCMKTRQPIPCQSEREFFEICGVDYLEPEMR